MENSCPNPGQQAAAKPEPGPATARLQIDAELNKLTEKVQEMLACGRAELDAVRLTEDLPEASSSSGGAGGDFTLPRPAGSAAISPYRWQPTPAGSWPASPCSDCPADEAPAPAPLQELPVDLEKAREYPTQRKAAQDTGDLPAASACSRPYDGDSYSFNALFCGLSLRLGDDLFQCDIPALGRMPGAIQRRGTESGSGACTGRLMSTERNPAPAAVPAGLPEVQVAHSLDLEDLGLASAPPGRPRTSTEEKSDYRMQRYGSIAKAPTPLPSPAAYSFAGSRQAALRVEQAEPQADLAAAQGAAQGLAEERDGLSARLEQAAADTQQVQAQLEQALAALEACEELRRQEADAHAEEMQAHVEVEAALQRRVEELQSLLRTERDAAEQRLQEVQAQLEASAALRQQEAAARTEEERAHEGTVNRLAKMLNQAEERCDALAAEVAEQDQQLGAALQKNVDLCGEKRALLEKAAAAEQRAISLEGKVEHLSEQLAATQELLRKARGDAETSEALRMLALQDHLEAAAAAAEREAQLQGEMERLKTLVASAWAEQRRMSEAASQSTCQLEQALAALEACEELRRQEAHAHAEEMQARLEAEAALQRRVEELEGQLEVWISTTAAAMQETANALSQQLEAGAAAQAHAHHLQGLLGNATARAQSAEAIAANLQEQLDAATKRCLAAEAQMARMAAAAEALHQQLAAKRAQWQEAETRAAAQAAWRAGAEAELRTKQEEMYALKERLAQLESVAASTPAGPASTPGRRACLPLHDEAHLAEHLTRMLREVVPQLAAKLAAATTAAALSTTSRAPDPDPLAEQQVAGQMEALLADRAQLKDKNEQLLREKAVLEGVLGLFLAQQGQHAADGDLFDEGGEGQC